MSIEIKDFIGWGIPLESGIKKGIRWTIYRNDRHGNINGYVQIPDDHKWRQLTDWESEFSPDLSVHGGITYGITEDGWIGFDTAHSKDYWAGSQSHSRSINDLNAIHWTQQMVVKETKKLAKQIASSRACKSVSTIPKALNMEPLEIERIRELEMTIHSYIALEQRIRELHKPITHTDGMVSCVGCEQEYPCQTIQALEGEK